MSTKKEVARVLSGSKVRTHAAQHGRTVPEEQARRTIFRAICSALRSEECTRIEYQQARILGEDMAETELERVMFERAIEVWEKNNTKIARARRMLWAPLDWLLVAAAFLGKVWRKLRPAKVVEANEESEA
jgi:hypothetical protein